MRDSLDLVALAQQANEYKQTARKYRNRTLIILTIWSVASIVLSNMLSVIPGTLYVSDGDTWQSVDLPGAPMDIQISESGIIWISTASNGGLSRYDGKIWTHFDEDDFGTDTNGLILFTLIGEDLWGVSGSNVFHFSNDTWTAYPNVASSSSSSTEIVAGDFGVMVMNPTGDITRYDGTHWEIHSASELLPGFENNGDYWPRMLRIPNGDIWLTWAGVWRFDGQEWSLVVPPEYAQYYWLLGANDETVWMSTGYGLIAVDFTMEEWQIYDSEQMGLTDTTPDLYASTFDTDTVWVATDTEILQFDGDTWTNVAIPSIDAENQIYNIARYNNTLWLATHHTDIWETSCCVKQVILSISGIVSLLLFLFLWQFPIARINMERARESHDRLHQILPDLQEYAPLYEDAAKIIRRLRNSLLLILLFIGILVFIRLPQYVILLTLILILLWGVSPLLIALRNPTLDTENRKYLHRNLWLTGAIFTGIILVGLLLVQIIMPLLVSASSVLIIASTLAVIALTLLLTYTVLSAPAITIAKGPLAKGDYDKALHWIEKLRQWMPQYANFISIQGLILLFTEQSQKAEQVWREMLTETQNSASLGIAIGLANLGYALDRQKRYDEALPLFTGAIEMVPENGSLPQALANHYQQQNIYPERTLELTEYALQFSRKPRLNYFLQRYNWGQLLGTRALALANVGRFDEAEAMMQRALAEADHKFRPGMAALHCTAGQIKYLQKDHTSARQHFQTALELDPNGANGQIAQKALKTLEQGG